VPWSYDIDTDKDVAFTTGTGVLTDQEVFDGVMSLYDDPRFHPDLRGLFDYRGVGTLKVSSETMAKLAAKRRYSDQTRTAFLVNGPLGFGLGRVYQSWVDLGQVKITYDRAEAVAWLNEGVPPEKHIT
jgi:hypothetical protein